MFLERLDLQVLLQHTWVLSSFFPHLWFCYFYCSFRRRITLDLALSLPFDTTTSKLCSYVGGKDPLRHRPISFSSSHAFTQLNAITSLDCVPSNIDRWTSWLLCFLWSELRPTSAEQLYMSDTPNPYVRQVIQQMRPCLPSERFHLGKSTPK